MVDRFRLLAACCAALAAIAACVPRTAAAQPALTLQTRLHIPVPADFPVCRPGTIPNEKDIYYDVVVDVDGNPATGSPQLGGSEIVIRYGLVGVVDSCTPARASLLSGSRVVFFRHRASDGGFDTVSNNPVASVGTLRVATGPGRWAGRALDLSIPAGRAELAGIGPQSRFQLAAAYNSGRLGAVEFKNYDFVGFAGAGDDVGDEPGDVIKCASYSRRPDRCAENAELDAFIDIAGFQAALATSVIDTGSYALNTDSARAGFIAVRSAGDGELRFGGADFTGDQVGESATGKQFFAVNGALTRYALLADVGAAGDPVTLVRSTTVPTLRTQSSEVTTRGEFAGDRGQVIRWTLLQEVTKSSVAYAVTYLFETDDRLGALTLVDFADLAPEGDAQGRLRVYGNLDRDYLELVTTNGAGDRGLSHSTAYRLARGATFAGYAANRATELASALQAGTQAFDRAGAIGAGLAAAGTASDGSRLYGPGDVATAYAYRVDPNARTASISIAVTSAARGERGDSPPPRGTESASSPDAFGLPAGTRVLELVGVDGGRASVVVTPDPLVAADANGANDVYVVGGGATALASAGADGRALPAASGSASASSAGHVVGFASGGELRVWERRLGTSRRIAAANPDPSGGIAISADGAVAVVATPDRLVASDTNAVSDVYAIALAGNAATLVSRTAQGAAAGDSDRPAASSDGRRIAFTSRSAALDPRDGNGSTRDVFLADLDAGTVRVLQRSASGNRDSDAPAISADGSVVAFATAATNWFGTGDGAHVAVWSAPLADVQSVAYAAGATRLAVPVVSANGRYVAFGAPAASGATAVRVTDLATAGSATLFESTLANPALALDADGARLFAAGTGAAPKRIDLAAAAGAAPTQPIGSAATGAWYDPQQPGQGFSFEHVVLGGQPVLVASWFTYANGRASWLVGAGPVRGDTAAIDFVTARGGGFPPAFDPARVQRAPWGRATVRFYSADRARVDWSTNEGGYSKSSLGLARLTRPKSSTQDATGGVDACYTGSWANPAQDGHGFVLQVIPLGAGADSLVAVWYVFEPDGTPLWLLGQAPIENRRAVVPFTRFTGALFPPAYSDSQVRSEPWGTATFEFRGGNDVGVSWRANDARYGTGALALSRVTPASPERACR